jgi:(E)-4-hydroxy-3-methylbut-2-enyl-diphosphate synthase
VEHLSSIKRRKTKKINLDYVQIGGDTPVVVQSMTNTDTRDIKATVIDCTTTGVSPPICT